MRALAPCAAAAFARQRLRQPQARRLLRAVTSASSASDGGGAASDGSVPLRNAPPGLDGLRLTLDGELVDERGRALNALGATRFDVAVQAMRGAFATPARPEDSHERAPPGQMLDALVRYPVEWLFQTIARVPPGPPRDAFANEVAAVVRRVCGDAAVLPNGVSQAAKGDTYVSVRVKALVGSSAEVNEVLAALRQDARVKMAS